MRGRQVVFGLVVLGMSGCADLLGAGDYELGDVGTPAATPRCGAAAVPVGGDCVAVGVPSVDCPVEEDGFGSCEHRIVQLTEECTDPTDVTWYVDGSHGGASDGSEELPFINIQDAVSIAGDGDVVLVQPGTYAEAVRVIDKHVKIFGSCDSTGSGLGVSTTIINSSDDVAVTVSNAGAQNTELHNLTVLGIGGVQVELADGVVIDRVQANQTAGTGIVVLNSNATRITSTTISSAGGAGLVLVDTEGTTMEDSTITDTLAIGIRGHGIEVFRSKSLVLRRSRVLNTPGTGLWLADTEATLEEVLVENSGTRSDYASGIRIDGRPGGSSATVRLVKSLVVGSSHTGIEVRDTTLEMDLSVVADNGEKAPALPDQDRIGTAGHGIRAVGANVDIQRSVVERSRGTAIHAADSGLSITDSIVRATEPHDNGSFGDAIAIYSLSGPGNEAAILRRVLVENSARGAVVNFGSVVQLQGVLMSCNARDAIGEDFAGQVLVANGPFPIRTTVEREFLFRDQGQNVCGCEDSWFECERVTLGLEPSPSPLDALPLH